MTQLPAGELGPNRTRPSTYPLGPIPVNAALAQRTQDKNQQFLIMDLIDDAVCDRAS